MHKIKNLSKVRIKGLNQERTISKIAKESNLYNLNRIEKSISEFEVKNSDLKKVRNQLQSQGFEVEILSNNGFSPFLKRFCGNLGVLIAIVLSFVTYILQFGIIWQVKVFGTEVLNNNEITSYISQNFSKFKGEIDTKQVETSLKENFKRISSVSVSIQGQSMVININESFYPPEMEGNFSAIYSDVDCKIVDVDLIQGTLAVAKGDIVQKGDILVYPYIIDSQGEKRDVKPDASIKAEVWLIGEIEHSDSYYQTYRTGKVLECNVISLFGLNIYSNTPKCEFESFECEESQDYLSKNNVLPLVLHKKIYFETKTELIEKSFEEVKEQKLQEAKQKALIYFEDCDIIKNEDINIISLAGVTQVEYIITVERNIGVTYEDLHEEGRN